MNWISFNGAEEPNRSHKLRWSGNVQAQLEADEAYARLKNRKRRKLNRRQRRARAKKCRK